MNIVFGSFLIVEKIAFLILTLKRFFLDDHKVVMKCPVVLILNNMTLTPVGVAQKPVQRWDWQIRHLRDFVSFFIL